MGHQRKLSPARPESGPPPETDIAEVASLVGFGPQTDSCTVGKGPQPGLRLLCFCPHEPAALQALDRPDFVRNRLCAGRQRHPRLHGGGENVIRWTEIR